MRVADETAPTFLDELRAAQNTVVSELRETNAKLDGLIAARDMTAIGSPIGLLAIRGRVRRVEGTMEAMARVMSDGAAG